jgi:hypothetical protein
MSWPGSNRRVRDTSAASMRSCASGWRANSGERDGSPRQESAPQRCAIPSGMRIGIHKTASGNRDSTLAAVELLRLAPLGRGGFAGDLLFGEGRLERRAVFPCGWYRVLGQGIILGLGQWERNLQKVSPPNPLFQRCRGVRFTSSCPTGPRRLCGRSPPGA